MAATYYPPTGKKDAVVMLLHHIDAKKGGNQQKGQFKAVSNVLAYRLEPGAGGALQAVVVEPRRVGWRRAVRP